MYALLLLSSIAQTAIVPLLPAVQRGYDLDASALAWILALPSLAMLMSATPLGILGDRIGNGRVTAAAGVVMALSVLAQGTPSLAVLLVARSGFGVGYGAVWTAGLAWLAGLRATNSSRRMAASVTASAVGSTIGPILSGTLANTFGFAAPFVVTGVVALVVSGLLLTVPELRGGGPVRTSARYRRDAPQRYAFGRASLAVLRHPPVLAGTATLALCTGAASLLQLLVPVQLHDSGHSAQEIGLVFSAGALVYLGMCAVWVQVGPRITNLRANAWLAVLLAVTLVPPVIGPGIMWVTAAAVLSGVPRSAISAVSYALATDGRDAHGPGRGTVIGVLNSAWAAATVVVPVVAGTLNTLGGPRLAYAAAAAATAATAAALRRGARPASLRPSTTAPPADRHPQTVSDT